MSTEQKEEFLIKVNDHCHPTKSPIRFDIKIPTDATVKVLYDAILGLTLYRQETFIMKARLSEEIPTSTEKELKADIARFFDTTKPGVLLLSRSKEWDQRVYKTRLILGEWPKNHKMLQEPTQYSIEEILCCISQNFNLPKELKINIICILLFQVKGYSSVIEDYDNDSKAFLTRNKSILWLSYCQIKKHMASI